MYTHNYQDFYIENTHLSVCEQTDREINQLITFATLHDNVPSFNGLVDDFQKHCRKRGIVYNHCDKK